MKISDFKTGMEFTTAEGSRRWRVTDIGSRVVVAISLDGGEVVRSSIVDGEVRETGRKRTTGSEAEARGDLRGPPYGVVEHVFDEYDQQGCEPLAQA